MKYHGVDQFAVIDSIARAVEFLDRHVSGPAMRDVLTAFAASGCAADLARAHSPAEMDAALHDRDCAAYLLLKSAKFLEHHALLNTDGKAEQTFKDLRAWGAFNGAITGRYTRLDAEIDSTIAASCLQTLAGRKTLREDVRALLPTIAPHDYAKMEPVALALLAEMQRAASTATGVEIAAAFLAGTELRERHIVLKGLQTLTFEAHPGLHAPNPIELYGILVCPYDITDKDKARQQSTVAKRFRETAYPIIMKQILADGLDTFCGVGIMRNDNKNLYVVFSGTLDTAKAIAIAFPTHEIRNSAGQTIMAAPPEKHLPPCGIAPKPDAPRP